VIEVWSARCDQTIWHTEDALSSTIGDRLVEKPELIAFQANRPGPKSPHFRSSSLAAVSPESLCVGRQSTTLTIPIRAPGGEVFGPMRAVLMIEDQPTPIIQIKICLEALCGVNQKPMQAAPGPGLMHLALGTPQAGPPLPKGHRPHRINTERSVSRLIPGFDGAVFSPKWKDRGSRLGGDIGNRTRRWATITGDHIGDFGCSSNRAEKRSSRQSKSLDFWYTMGVHQDAVRIAESPEKPWFSLR